MSHPSTSNNHAKAPLCAAFVNLFREVFGDVKVLYVEENGVVLGEKEDGMPGLQPVGTEVRNGRR
jgi:hypothetical protein